METADIIGYAAAACTTLANVPQAWKILRERLENAISLPTYLILASGTGLWVVYGVIKEDCPLILANGISTLISIILIVLKIVPQRKLETIHRKVEKRPKKK